MTNERLFHGIDTLRRAEPFFRNRNGATAVEYALLAGLVAIAVIMSAGNVSEATNRNLHQINHTLADQSDTVVTVQTDKKNNKNKQNKQTKKKK